MKTLLEMVKEVASGAKRIDTETYIDKPYEVKCYKVGEIIRIDLKPTKAE